MSMMDTIKEHPYMTVGGAAAVLVIVFVISRSGGGTGGAVVVSGAPPVDPMAGQLALANVAGQVQLGTASLGADVASQQVAANLHIVDSNNATAQNIEAIRAKGATDIAALAATVSTDNIRAQESVALNAQQTQLEMLQTSQTNETERQRISTQGTIDALQLQASTLLGSQAIAANVATHQQDVNAAMFHDQVTSQITIATHAQDIALQTAKYQADTQVVLNREWAPVAIQLQQIAATAATSNIGATTAAQVAIAQAQNNHGSLFGGLYQW